MSRKSAKDLLDRVDELLAAGDRIALGAYSPDVKRWVHASVGFRELVTEVLEHERELAAGEGASAAAEGARQLLQAAEAENKKLREERDEALARIANALL